MNWKGPKQPNHGNKEVPFAHTLARKIAWSNLTEVISPLWLQACSRLPAQTPAALCLVKHSLLYSRIPNERQLEL